MVDKFGLPVVISGQIVTVFVRSGIGNDLVTKLCLLQSFCCLGNKTYRQYKNLQIADL